MKKRLFFIIIIAILICSIIPTFTYAEGGEDVDGDSDKLESFEKYIPMDELKQHEQEKGKNTVNEIFTEGTTDVEPAKGGVRKEKVGETYTSSSGSVGKLCEALTIPADAINKLMGFIIDYAEPKDSKYKGSFTIENLVFNRYQLFNIDFLDYNAKSSDVNNVFKKSVATWYYSLRNIAIAGSLIVLIYIGIRMALSTIGKDQAKYKKMFIAWVKSFVILFIMHYIIVFFLQLQDWTLDVIGKFVQGQGFEEYLINNTSETFETARGWSAVSVTIQYYVLVYFQITFFITYFKRFLKVGFLFIISPLVTLTYSIDFAGDGEAQAYKAWLKEIAFAIFLQSLHAVVYAVFILSAAEIAKAVPIMGALLLMALSRTEKIAKSTLKMSGEGIGDQKVFDKIKGFRKK